MLCRTSVSTIKPTAEAVARTSADVVFVKHIVAVSFIALLRGKEVFDGVDTVCDKVVGIGNNGPKLVKIMKGKVEWL